MTWSHYGTALLGKHYCPGCRQPLCFKRKWWFGILSILGFLFGIIPLAILFAMLFGNGLVGMLGGLIVGLAVDKYLIIHFGALSKEIQPDSILKSLLYSGTFSIALSLIFFIIVATAFISSSQGIQAAAAAISIIVTGRFFISCWPFVYSVIEFRRITRQRATIQFWPARLILAILALLGSLYLGWPFLSLPLVLWQAG